jgi:indolepyruvate ferredoxin oxidoreductase beta subunit
MIKIDIIIAGVGGQGILSIASAIGMAALKSNLNLKQSEVHGMSQRGGAVQSHMRISDNEIASDLIPFNKAQLILSVEPLESLRYLPYLSPKGWLVSNSVPFININNYPDVKKVIEEIEKLPNHVLLDSDEIAKNAGSLRASNMVMLGAASAFINLPVENFEQSIVELFQRKGEEVVKMNLKAFNTGREISLQKK